MPFKPGDVVRLKSQLDHLPGETRTWMLSLVKQYGMGPFLYLRSTSEHGFNGEPPHCFLATMEGEVITYPFDGFYLGNWLDFRECDLELDAFLTAVHRRRRKIHPVV